MDDAQQLLEAVDLPEAITEEGEPTDERVERILEHVDDSLKMEDALLASIGAASGDLMLMQYRLRQALDETLQQTPDSLTGLTEVMPAMNTFIKVSQQIDKFVQLSIKVRKAQGGD